MFWSCHIHRTKCETTVCFTVYNSTSRLKSHHRLTLDIWPTWWVVSVSGHGNLCVLVCLCKVCFLLNINTRSLPLWFTSNIKMHYLHWFQAHVAASVDADLLWPKLYTTKSASHLAFLQCQGQKPLFIDSFHTNTFLFALTTKAFSTSPWIAQQKHFLQSPWIHSQLCGSSKDEILVLHINKIAVRNQCSFSFIHLLSFHKWVTWQKVKKSDAGIIFKLY